ncbi:TetR family transcriptional regulator [Streptomyces sp. NBRC 14336]|uniref:TetR/AcrR family transcriptional regulator n=1 Tax=Streptomyces sp. NBRC 14336 TaxID=3030992 RepID=UPI0024A47533|nr:TetR family transcriptional regulator [Streptomyces sp. NBRC 14336]WBO81871.1 TetR family transcriptional regulator [Streptomyces sp. SBE_14.2]GLW46560.1 TetR family transcriptional regulator [Streptomyces sp. NBRC 14336]
MSAPLPPFPGHEEPPADAPELLQLGSPDDEPCLRADAARNRARLLEAAGKLVAEHGASCVTMEAVAAAAKVGKGTVFRRFGDRTGLLAALLDHTEKKFQAAVITGPAPLGPGAPPLERLKAFGLALLRRSADELDLQLAAEPSAERRYSNAPRRFLRGHVLILLRQIVPDADCELLALTLMQYLDPSMIHYRTRICGMPADRVEAGWLDLVDRLTRSAPSA